MSTVKSVIKLTFRSIRTFFGRYMALLLIVALSAGFFAGLKMTQSAMIHTGDRYLSSQEFYDFRLLSTLGFTEEDAETLAARNEVKAAEGGYALDALMSWNGGTQPLHLMSLPENVNLPSLVEGRLPAAENECLADQQRFTEEDIGTVLSLSADNDDTTVQNLSCTEYTIVGLVDSPLYIGIDRGTTDIGNGSLYAFLYLPSESFAMEAYTEISLTLQETAYLYSDAYENLIETYEAEMTQCCKDLARDRYEKILSDLGLSEEMGESFGITKPETYVLTREENVSYVSFENDTAIVSGVANLFPIFFILIAMLVCITTMTRMVDEERTQIGVLKALGFSDGAILGKYLLYAGSATVIGWAIGFFLCTWALPQIFWLAYNALYDFSSMPYLFRLDLALLTLTVSLVGILGSTFLSVRHELGSAPAKLIRPRAAKNGKRILLEWITPLWCRLTFLQKITMRNMFRYKQRLILMLVGIGCCAGLVVTAFGVRDSMINIGTLQFEQIQTYQLEAMFDEGSADVVTEKLDGLAEVEDYLPAVSTRVDLLGEEAALNSVSLFSFREEDRIGAFWTLQSEGNTVSYPGKGEAVISRKAADKLSLSVGEKLQVRNADLNTYTLTVSGIFDNYINNFIFLSAETYEDAVGVWEANATLIRINGDESATAEKLTAMDAMTSVSKLSVTRENVDDALSCLNYIIWLIVGFSGALAFIVIFNLTNINLAERSREIATVQVLGFYPKETESYVLRENLVLSILASMIGLPLGTLFHRAVMSMILVDSFTFDVHITPQSYLLSLFFTILFAVIVNRFMKRQIGKIPMAESLKAVE